MTWDLLKARGQLMPYEHVHAENSKDCEIPQKSKFEFE
jgi:hypothetical protein